MLVITQALHKSFIKAGKMRLLFIFFFLNSKECVRLCVQHTHNLELIKELLGFFLVANDETRKNVTCLIKEAITSTIKNMDEAMVIGLLEFLQTDKKIKTLTDTSELTEDAIYAATVEQNSGTLSIFLRDIFLSPFCPQQDE